MSEAFTILKSGETPILIVGDHASAHVPTDIKLGVAPELLRQHIAIDIGVAQIAELLAERFGCTSIFGGVSRLVIDFNREEDREGLIPLKSDGHKIPGNVNVDRQTRLDRFYRPYHAKIAALLVKMNHPFILSLHSFTPRLGNDPDQIRPWEVGVLYNQDSRAARIAIPMLEAAGLIVGDQLPYSGRLLNATMNLHGEAHGIPYLGIEMRQDIVQSTVGQRRFAEILTPVLERCRAALA